MVSVKRSSDAATELPWDKRARLAPGTVFVASMNMRGQWASRPTTATTINVTSAQGKTSALRRDFSPMSLPGFPCHGRDDGGCCCFENAWQSLKEFEGVPFADSVAWWQQQTKGKRRYPRGKGKRVLWANARVQKLGYVASRKLVYVPEYDLKIRATPSFAALRRRVQQGEDVVVMDFDGPRTAEGGVTCVPISVELLRNKIEDERFPFGHGYVVAAGLAGIPLASFVGDGGGDDDDDSSSL